MNGLVAPRQSSSAGKRSANVQRQINRSAVLNMIRRRGPVTRPAIARQLGLSLPTVTKIADDLLAEELVISAGFTGTAVGRPAEQLVINGSQFSIIGVDLGGSKIFGAITDFSGEVLYEVNADRRSDDRASPEELVAFIERLTAPPGLTLPQIWGIGVGVPGITVRPDGIVVYSPSLEWRGLALQQLLSEQFGVRVLVDNDVNLAALGEWEFGVGKGSHSLVYITIGNGIGAGIVIDGQIHRGSHHAAGEVGHLIPGVSALGRRYDGFGALEEVASGHGLRLLASRAGDADIVPDGSDLIGLFEAAAAGQPWARSIVDGAVDHLAVAIAAIATVLDPEVVVLGGSVMALGHGMLDAISRRLDGAIPYVPRLEHSRIGYRAGALGAIAFVLEMTTDQVRLRQSH